MMTTEEKTLLAILTLAAVLVPVAFGTVLGWPVWSWLLLATPLLSILGLVARNILRRVQQEQLLWPPYAAPPVHVEQQDQAPHILIPDISLPSTLPDYPFRFSATAYWHPMRGSKTPYANPGALAKMAIIDRAKALTVAEHPDDVDVVRHRVESELGAVQPVASGGMETWADQVQLTLSEADQERLRRRSDLRKDDDLGERERNHECRKRTYLKEVFTSTGSAVTWRLAQKDNDVEDTVRLIGALAQLSVAVNDREVVPGLFRHLLPTPTPAEPASLRNGSCPDGSHPIIRCPLVGLPAGPISGVSPVALGYRALMDAAGFDNNPPPYIARQFALLLDKFEKPDAAQEIQRCFDAPATDTEPAESPTPDGELPDKHVPDGHVPRQEVPWRNPPLPTESEQDGQPQTDEHRASEQLEKPSD
jgi:hypothetical protein